MASLIGMRAGARVVIHAFTRMLVAASQQAAVGGQAVMDGVMMRGPSTWAVAIRRYNGEIIEVHRAHVPFGRRHAWARIPIVRGVMALGESLVIGFRALSVSAFYAAEALEEREGAAAPGGDPAEAADDVVIPFPTGGAQSVRAVTSAVDEDAVSADVTALPALDQPEYERADSDANPDTLKTWHIVLAMVGAFAFSIFLFKVTPALLASLTGYTKSSLMFVVVESVIRISIFMGYLVLVGLMPDMRVVFQYHSAEHKTINAWEHGIELKPELVNQQSRIHVRCGTAFMLWVFVVAIAVFGVFGHYFHPNLLGVILSRILLLPLIAGISFELIKFAGKYPDNPVLRGILAPGLWMQYLTTRQCNEEQCAVAIRSLQAVLAKEHPDATEQEALDALAAGDDALEVLA